MQEAEKINKEVWDKPGNGSRLFKVQQKLKWCKHRFIKWRKEQKGNAKVEIEMIQKEMEIMQEMGGSKDLDRLKQLKTLVDIRQTGVTRSFGEKKSTINWLKEGDRNTKCFYAVTADRRKRNMIYSLIAENGTECSGEEEIAWETTKYFETLFTSNHPKDCDEILERILRTIIESINKNLTKAMGGPRNKKSSLLNELQQSTWTGWYTPFLFFRSIGT